MIVSELSRTSGLCTNSE